MGRPGADSTADSLRGTEDAETLTRGWTLAVSVSPWKTINFLSRIGKLPAMSRKREREHERERESKCVDEREEMKRRILPFFLRN